MPYIRQRPLTYTLLANDNIDELSKLTGTSKRDLRNEFEKCQSYGAERVFWQVGLRWYSVKIDAMYVYEGIIDDLIYEAMRKGPQRETSIPHARS